MNIQTINNICTYYVQKAPTKVDAAVKADFHDEILIDIHSEIYINTLQPNIVRLLFTVIAFQLNPSDLKQIVSTSNARYEDEEFSRYKDRVKAKLYIERYLPKIYTILSKLSRT